MMVCSRLDLFHTGTPTTPSFSALMQAASCAFAWCANLSPTPTEYFGNFNPSAIYTSPFSKAIRHTASAQPWKERISAYSVRSDRANFESDRLVKPPLIGPEAQPRIGDVENLFAVHHVPPIFQFFGIVFGGVLLQVSVFKVHAFDLLPGQVSRAVADSEAAFARAVDQVRRGAQVAREIGIVLHCL